MVRTYAVEMAATGSGAYIQSDTPATTWPPTSNLIAVANQIVVQASGPSGSYIRHISFAKFDLSATGVLATATLTAARLKLWPTAVSPGQSINFVGQYWPVANWPITTADYTTTPPNGNAFNLTVTDWGAFTGGIGSYNTIPLSNLSNISLTGETGFYLALANTPTPTTTNSIQTSATTGQRLVLEIDVASPYHMLL